MCIHIGVYWVLLRFILPWLSATKTFGYCYVLSYSGSVLHPHLEIVTFYHTLALCHMDIWELLRFILLSLSLSVLHLGKPRLCFAASPYQAHTKPRPGPDQAKDSPGQAQNKPRPGPDQARGSPGQAQNNLRASPRQAQAKTRTAQNKLRASPDQAQTKPRAA